MRILQWPIYPTGPAAKAFVPRPERWNWNFYEPVETSLGYTGKALCVSILTLNSVAGLVLEFRTKYWADDGTIRFLSKLLHLIETVIDTQ
jgi:hypothetical protein